MFIAIILLLLGLFGFIPFQLSVGLTMAWLVVTGIGIGFLQQRLRRLPRRTGVETMIGATAPALTNIDHDGQIRFSGETWNARSLGPIIAQGTVVKIVRIDGGSGVC